MAKQLNFLATGQIIPTPLHQEMERSYLEYAMSVIVGRALPDVRDGLKPVHRRILYAMHELGLTPDRPYRKCARVVGDVLGKYHPHGDQSVYEALVRMVQDFSSRYPLLSGHGNFGSIDNDPPAAMRYTETRLASIADTSLLEGISDSIVNFTNNFDNSQQEPVVLPAQLPFLILNGCSGIAVGMATNIPPHNLGEIIDGLIALIDDPNLPQEKLWRIIPGPDFPTGGIIQGRAGIIDTYTTGKGSITIRGVSKLETIYREGRRRKEITAIVVTQLPYQVNKAAWIEKIAELVNAGKIEGIADIRDESDRQGMRVVIELKKDVKPQTVLNALYHQTALQTNFGAILLALVNNQPRQLSLRELLQEFLSFREETLTRQYDDELQQTSTRLHLVEGLLTALDNLDRVIDILRNSADGTSAKLRFQEELSCSNDQADSILAMPLRRLTGLEKQKLESEQTGLQTRIQELETLLNNRHEFLKALKKELRGLKRKFADPRRTQIVIVADSSKETAKDERVKTRKKVSHEPVKDQKKDVTPAEPKSLSGQPKLTLFTPQPPPENALICLNYDDEIYWTTPEDKQIKEQAIYAREIGKNQELIVILDTGKAYPISLEDIPPKPGQPLLSLLTKTAQSQCKSVITRFFQEEVQKTQNILLLSAQGRIKRLHSKDLEEIGNRGLSLIKLKEGDTLGYAPFCMEGQNLILATHTGRILRVSITDEQIPLMGRSSQGNNAIKLVLQDNLAGCAALGSQDYLVLVTRAGYGKRVSVNQLRLGKLGDIGSPGLQFAVKKDSLCFLGNAIAKSQILLQTNKQRQILKSVDEIGHWGTDGAGEPLIQLQSEEYIEFVKLLAV
ncbi:MAG: DNA gyrase subunit A [Chroococcopsis gigantea SAG 12.99]|jgi:DNA gyrase subunit A|nr:DNA topoisomerase 4 subunit A [Chlorogloea purpurea SAG 13.99]MDV3001736.1 DNA gyrase subunit A [Chroococcopsis gigantea SAG 12.99]